MVDKSTSQNRGHRHSLGCSLHRPQNRPEPANTGRRGRATVRPDRLSPKLPVNGGRGAPRAMPAPDGDANSHAAVSSSPGDTVSAPCRGSRPGPAALDRPPQSRGLAPARPGRYGRLDESSTGGQRREVAMGKGLPGGRRQAGSIDYRTEVRSFVPRSRRFRNVTDTVADARSAVVCPGRPCCCLPWPALAAATTHCGLVLAATRPACRP